MSSISVLCTNWLQGPEQIHVSKFYKESKNGKFVSYITENVRTLYQTFREGAYASNNGPCLGWRETLTSPYQVSHIHFSSQSDCVTWTSTHRSFSGSTMMRRCCVRRTLDRECLRWAHVRNSWLASTRRTDPSGYCTSRPATRSLWSWCRSTTLSAQMHVLLSYARRKCQS